MTLWQHKKSCILFLIFYIFLLPLYSLDPDTTEDTALTEEDEYGIIMENKKGLVFTAVEDTPDVVTREEMEREGAKDLWEAVRNVPGVIQSGGGARNDSSFTVRGFDSASMPLFLDGVSQANTYRGDNDVARTLTGDLESVKIEKGYSTLLLGANTMGGAIIVRTAKPEAPFELSATSGFNFDNLGGFAGNNETVSIGSRMPLFYAQGVFQYRGTDHYRIPDTFEPDNTRVPGTLEYQNPQRKGVRQWSDSNDIKATLLAGWTPLNTLDISLAYTYQDSYKGLSPPDSRGNYHNGEKEVWEWPLYRRHTLNLAGEWMPGDFVFKTNIYYQKFDNRLIDYYSLEQYALDMYDPAKSTDYDDWSFGAHIEGAWDINLWNKAEAAVNFRRDDHKVRLARTGEETVHINEDTISAAAEYTMEPLHLLGCDSLHITAGAGLDRISPNEFYGRDNESIKEYFPDYTDAKLKKEGYISKTVPWTLLCAEAGIFYDITKLHTIRFTYARKNHFPTMSQRYSTRAGEAKANPWLSPEWADHFETGWKGSIPLFSEGLLKLWAAVYYSNITNKIVQFNSVNVNVDDTAMWGAEASLEFSPLKKFTLGSTFSLNRYCFIYNKLMVNALAYYPQITSSAYMIITPAEKLSLVPSFQYIDSRYTDADASNTLDAYCLVNIKGTYNFSPHTNLSVSVNNLLDTLYEIREFNPMPGRNYDISLMVKY